MLTQHGRLLAFIVVLISMLSLLARPAGAQITVGGNSGEVSPVDPSSWGEETDAQIGINSGKTGTVTVAGGSSVSPGDCLLGYFPNSNGTVTVTGSGSSWSAPYGMYVGCFGAGTLNVADGGTVSSYCDYIGVYGGGTGTATVSGAGSTWINNDELQVGVEGTGTLRVASGGAVTTNAAGSIGSEAGSNGTVTITGTGSTWTTAGELNMGYSGTGTLRVESGGKVASSSQNFEGTYIGRDAGAIGTAVVTGPGSTWTNTTTGLIVGSEGSGTLRVENGGKVSSVSESVLGYHPGASGTVVVTGGGSAWTHNGFLYIGGSLDESPGGSGTLTVDSGGTASCGTWCYVASNSAASGSVTVSGSGSTWATSDLYIGYAGIGTLRVDGGGTVASSGSCYLGYNAGSSGTAVITGPGSKWTCDSLSVGSNGSTLRVENGGAVSSSSGGIGGTAIVTGSGSTWTNDDYLVVGGTLRVENGGVVSSASGDIAGTATVTGLGSAWTNSGYLWAYGTLTVDAGAKVTTGTLLYATQNSLKGDGVINTGGLIVDTDLVFDATHGTSKVFSFGTGGVLNLNVDGTGAMGAGFRGNGSLLVAQGSKIMSVGGYLGYDSGSNGTATVTGAGSTWTNTDSLWVGKSGTGTLRVENGGTVGGTDGYVISHGTATVTGVNSTWANTGSLRVGSSGAGLLRVEKGGTVTSGDGYVGHGIGSNGTAIVTGAGSTWASTGSVQVGYYDAGSLRVEKGGTISDFLGQIRWGTAVVTGSGSTWASSGDLRLEPAADSDATNGTLTVGGGGKVTAQSLYLAPGPRFQATVNLHVSGNGMVVLGPAQSGSYTLTNEGKINLYADAFLATGTYSPFTASPGATLAWAGTGSYNSFGGAWDNTAKTFTVDPAAGSGAGAVNPLATGERLLVTDLASGQRVGASFGSVAAGANFSAALLSSDSLSGLMAVLPADQSVLSAWNITTNLTGGQALLAFDVGPGQPDLAVWHYDGTAWSAYAAPDLTYGDDGIADFAVTGFGAYALSILSPHDGDANNDGRVSVIDLGVLAKNYDTASGATWATADFSRDGAVSVVDLGVLAKNYDWVAGGSAIPEPGSAALLVTAGLALLGRRGRAG